MGHDRLTKPQSPDHRSNFPSGNVLSPHYDDAHSDDDNIRIDMFGNQIIPGNKKHKIVFADEIAPNKGIAKVYYVESYKKYNHSSYNENNNSECFCHCALF